MPLPIPSLDDRRFDDLVAELHARAASHVPEWRPVPGDPGAALLDLVAWLGETIIYRLNLLPERQRRAFLNLLHLPLRAARPARGLVCIDPPAADRAALLPPATLLAAGPVKLSTDGELTPLPLALAVVIKDAAADLDAQGGSAGRRFFRARTLVAGHDVLRPGAAVDGYLHLACAAPLPGADADALRALLADAELNLGVVPDSLSDAEQAQGASAPRRLVVEIAQALAGADESDPAQRQATAWWPLDLLADTSAGGTAAGVLRLRLPPRAALFVPPGQDDAEYTGAGTAPPEAPADLPGPLLFWLRLSCADDDALALGWLGVNAVEVVAQETLQPRVVGLGTGEPDQAVVLSGGDIDAGSVQLSVQEAGGWTTWALVDHFGGRGPDDRVAVLDDQAGILRFGDGVRGKRPPLSARVRAGWRSGGGAAGNLAPGGVKEVVGGPRGLKVRHEWPLAGGADAETVPEAERRIPEFLQHRDRAVTAADFRALALAHPTAAVARAEVWPGLLPVPGPATGRSGVPGVVSVFVLPPGGGGVGDPPRPSRGLLADVFTWLRPRTVVGTELYVLSPEFVPVAVALSVRVEDPRAQATVLAAVEAALAQFLSALPPGGQDGAGWPFAAAGGASDGSDQEQSVVDAEELATQAARVPGVRAIGPVRVWRGTAQGWQEALDGRIPLGGWQVPDLQAVSAQFGTGTPQPPGPLSAPDPSTATLAPAPTLSALC